ncbi:hypothetical protein HELRODRAFT_161566 [Helobdella robusta]|uniref:Uncharacterized protein n=1 Tax=Helobdella robusta TaxID=6412 RepID=T1ERM4_HELRO|nr:hypothetical protein HELRODRAFT_161566 [Helobdella robusta]ESO02311.1 hypothetical protein HELRODRAFT_161566 [Helobdella robusta]
MHDSCKYIATNKSQLQIRKLRSDVKGYTYKRNFFISDYKSVSFWYQDNEIQKCLSRVYGEFTHVCSVTNYLPDIDYCCCTVDETFERNKNNDNVSILKKKRLKKWATNYGENKTDTAIRLKRSTEQTSVLCCRYHQDWNKFRCQRSDDYFDPNS